jgi:hypothetical protein
MGATWYIREWLGWNVDIDENNAWYVAGEATEVSVEIGVTFGSAALKKGAAKAGSRLLQAGAREVFRKEVSRVSHAL